MLRAARIGSLLAGALGGVLAGCAGLPPLEPRSVSSAFTETGDTALGRAITPRTRAHAGVSGIHALPDSRDAFATRMLLARTAERSLDIQYYIWHEDLTGTLLLAALLDAADRDVRVRLLLDDHHTGGMDATLAALDAHRNVEVRLFNPFAIRQPRALAFAADFVRLNRRMHNKSFTADNQATIIGGRNIGDEYFGAAEGVLFSDLDVVAIGPVVDDVSRDFDRYWASPSSYPAARLLSAASPASRAQLAANAARIERDPRARAYVQALRESPFVAKLLRGELELQWAATRMLSDDPAKALGRAASASLMIAKLQQIIGGASREVQIVSPYFVPTADGVRALSALARRGVRIKVLTNAFEATDVGVVHAGYAKRRYAMLDAGIALFELRRSAAAGPKQKGAGVSGSSASSLHAKTFGVDRSRAFIGSFNFDPRSARLNTELGFVIDSPAMAGAIADAFDRDVRAAAYEVRRAPDGGLRWIEQRDGEEFVHRSEPGTSAWQRAWIGLLSVLPIEWLL